MKTALLCAVALAGLIGGGIYMNKSGYERGVDAGVEQGRYQQQNYTGVMGMAAACYQLGEKYDETPAAEKVAKGVPMKWDNATTCDKLKATANSYLGKPATADPENYLGLKLTNHSE